MLKKVFTKDNDAGNAAEKFIESVGSKDWEDWSVEVDRNVYNINGGNYEQWRDGLLGHLLETASTLNKDVAEGEEDYWGPAAFAEEKVSIGRK